MIFHKSEVNHKREVETDTPLEHTHIWFSYNLNAVMKLRCTAVCRFVTYVSLCISVVVGGNWR